MNSLQSGPEDVGVRLNQLLRECGCPELSPDVAKRFGVYLEILVRWNARTNLTAIRDEEGILRRHFVESIAAARSLPAGVTTLLDFGSGAGFPGIPIALCRAEIRVTLAESQNKKAAFLREAVRALGVPIDIHSGRAEALKTTFDCVTLRAVDRMEEAVRAGSRLVTPHGWLAPLTTTAHWEKLRGVVADPFEWSDPIVLPGGNDRVLIAGRKLT